ncbi:MAG: metallophosphoesterase [Thermoprotei archaeon]|nr:metallophosphoesterase [Thermoprotei archaeon]
MGQDLIYAVSDVHSPRFLHMFRSSLKTLTEEPCFFIMAGDMIDKGKVEMLKPIVKDLRSKWLETPLVAVFGNEEYHSVREELRGEYPEITWLDDGTLKGNCGNLKIAIVGTQGALDRLTSWQARNMPWLLEDYLKKPDTLTKLISEARGEGYTVILVSHYALTSENLKGEDPRAWPEMYSRKMEKLVKELKPDIAIHGHAHNGKPYALVGGVPVYNVAIPLTKTIKKIKLAKGLLEFTS